MSLGRPLSQVAARRGALALGIIVVAASSGRALEPEDPAIGLRVMERDLDSLLRFLQGIEGETPEHAVAEMIREDLRGTLFRLEATARLYSRSPEDAFDRLRDTFKRAEDALGAVSLARDLAKLAEKLRVPELERHFTRLGEIERDALVELLDELGWMSRPGVAVGQVRVAVRQAQPWMPGAQDRTFLIERIRADLRGVRAEVAALKFDSADIELGLHELRRQLRWTGIQIQALDGFVVAEREDDLPLALVAWIGELESSGRDIFAGKYARTSPTREPDPIRIPQQMYALLSELVRMAGDAKDLAESQIQFEHAAVELGLLEERRAEILGTLLEHQQVPERTDHRALAIAWQNQLREADLLGEFEMWMRNHN